MGFKEQGEWTVSFIGGAMRRNGVKKRMDNAISLLLESGTFPLGVSVVSALHPRCAFN